MQIHVPPSRKAGELRPAPAPELAVSAWMNTDTPLTLAMLRGQVVAIHAFQMLCPGCVLHGLPQTQRIHATFHSQDVAVIGLHSVFEHHAAMTPIALAAFIHEFGLSFPIAIDADALPGALPTTMQCYQMRGTPTLVLIDRAGQRRFQYFGQVDDMQVGAAIAALLAEQA